MMRDNLADLVQQMIDRGILFDDAQREFERVFLTRALAKTQLQRLQGRQDHRPPPQHAQPQDGELQDQKSDA